MSQGFVKIYPETICHLLRHRELDAKAILLWTALEVSKAISFVYAIMSLQYFVESLRSWQPLPLVLQDPCCSCMHPQIAA